MRRLAAIVAILAACLVASLAPAVPALAQASVEPAPAIDRAILENALAEPAPGALEDLDLLLRQGGGNALDAETAAFLRSTLADLDETAWSGPDQLARDRLLREIEASQSP